jgi:hypothetical protein
MKKTIHIKILFETEGSEEEVKEMQEFVKERVDNLAITLDAEPNSSCQVVNFLSEYE